MSNNLIIILVMFICGCVTAGNIEIPEHLKAHAERLHQKCQEEVGVDDALIAQSTDGHLPNDRSLQCYIHCLFKTTGLMDEDNTIHLEHILEVLPTEMQEIVENLVSTCGTKHGADACETAYLTVKCYFDADPVHSMLI